MHGSVSESEAAQLCLTLCDPMDCSLPGSSIHGIFQAIVLEWTASLETWIQSLGREDPLEKGNGNPLQYSCLGNPMDRGRWWAAVHGLQELDMA